MAARPPGGSMSKPAKPVWAFSILVATLILVSPPLSGPYAAADTWPSRPVRFIITLGPGSGVDIGARLFADKLSERWGQPVVVENRPGGDGMVAITSFLSAHDDHTLLVSPVSSFTAHPYFHDKLPYDPQDLIPIARISKTVVAVSVPASLNVNSLKELEALARAKPDQLNWTTATGFTDFCTPLDSRWRKCPIRIRRAPSLTSRQERSRSTCRPMRSCDRKSRQGL